MRIFENINLNNATFIISIFFFFFQLVNLFNSCIHNVSHIAIVPTKDVLSVEKWNNKIK